MNSVAKRMLFIVEKWIGNTTQIALLQTSGNKFSSVASYICFAVLFNGLDYLVASLENELSVARKEGGNRKWQGKWNGETWMKAP